MMKMSLLTCLIWINNDYEFGMFSKSDNKWRIYKDGGFVDMPKGVNIENLPYLLLDAPE